MDIHTDIDVRREKTTSGAFQLKAVAERVDASYDYVRVSEEDGLLLPPVWDRSDISRWVNTTNQTLDDLDFEVLETRIFCGSPDHPIQIRFGDEIRIE
jgi:hypothetical protein